MSLPMLAAQAFQGLGAKATSVLGLPEVSNSAGLFFISLTTGIVVYLFFRSYVLKNVHFTEEGIVTGTEVSVEEVKREEIRLQDQELLLPNLDSNEPKLSRRQRLGLDLPPDIAEQVSTSSSDEYEQNEPPACTSEIDKNLDEEDETIPKERCVTIFYGTQTGKAKHFSEILAMKLEDHKFKAKIIDLKDYEPDDNLVQESLKNKLCIFIISTYIDGSPPDSCLWFCKWLEDASCDFRVSKKLLEEMKYCILGLGNSEYEDNFNKTAINLGLWLDELNAKSVIDIELADENVVKSVNGSIEADYGKWEEKVVANLMNENKILDPISNDAAEEFLLQENVN